MIVTNKIAKFIILIADKFNSLSICKELIAHERVHLEQWLRYWIVGFLPVYIYQYLKYGYLKMPLEVEAIEGAINATK